MHSNSSVTTIPIVGALRSLLRSAASCRLLFGFLPELLLANHGIPRPASLSAVAAATAGINLACATTTSVRFLFPIAITYGVAFGAYWCLVPAISSEVFGLSAFASVYTALIFAPALGCWLLAAQLAGRLYDAMSSGSSSQLGSWLKVGVKSGLHCTEYDMLMPQGAAVALHGPALPEQLGAASLDAGSDSRYESLLGAWGAHATQHFGCLVHRTWCWLLPGQHASIQQAWRGEGPFQDSRGSSIVSNGPISSSSDSSSTSSNPESGGEQAACVGPACFRLTFVVLALLCCVAVAASVSLTHRTAAKYKAQQQQQWEHELV
jgi:hypothetical protein